MATPTQQDMDNADVDLQKIAQVSNGDIGTVVTMRLGEEVKSIAKAVNDVTVAGMTAIGDLVEAQENVAALTAEAAEAVTEAQGYALAALANGLIFSDTASGITATNPTTNKYFWVSPSIRGGGLVDLFLNVGGVAQFLAAMPSDALMLDSYQVGRPVAAVTGTGLTAGTYVFATPVSVGATATMLRVYGMGGGATIQLKRFTRSGNINTQVGSDIAVVVANGANAIDLSAYGFRPQAGELIGFYTPTTGRLAYTPATAGDSGGYYDTAGNSSGFTDATATTNIRLEIGFDFSYTYVSTDRVKQLTIDVAAATSAAASNTAKLSDYDAVFRQIQPFGKIDEPITGTTVTAGTYAYAEEMIGDGVVEGARVYAKAAGTFKLRRFTRTDTTLTQVGSDYVVTLALGLNTLAPNFSVRRGELIGLYAASGVLAFILGAADSGGTYYGAGDVSTFSAATPSTTFALQVSLDIRYSAAPEDAHTVTVRNSARIALASNSYGASVYTQRGKSWLAKLSAACDWNIENFSISGNTVANILSRIRAGSLSYANLSLRDYGAHYVLISEMINSSNAVTLATYLDDMRQLIETVRGLGAEPILCSEWVVPAFGAGAQVALKQLADEQGCAFINVMPTGRLFDSSPRYPGYWGASHPGVRTNDMILAPMLDYVRSLGRPTQSMKIFRPRPGVVISTIADLMFDSLYDRQRLFKELQIGEYALTQATEGWYDKLDDSLNYAYEMVPSEYLALQNYKSAAFTDYALIETVIDAAPRRVRAAYLTLSDPSVEVYVRDFLSTPYATSGQPVGVWRQLLGSNGVFRIPRPLIRQVMRTDKMSFLIKKAGAFSLYEPKLTWVGQRGKPASPVKVPTRWARGAELLGATSCASTAGWTVVGGASAAVPADGHVPVGSTGAITVNASAKIKQAFSYPSVLGEDREVEIRVRCRIKPTIYNPGAGTYPAGSQVTADSFDLARLQVDFIDSAGSMPWRSSVGLGWKDCVLRTVLPSQDTGSEVQISASADVEVANVSVKTVD